MELKLGNEIFNDKEVVEYYALNGYFHSRFQGIKLDLVNIKDASPVKRTGTLQFNPGGWISKSGWILKDSLGTFKYDFNTEVNTLNDKPFDRNKSNILLLKKVQGPLQAPANVVATKPIVSTVKTFSTIDDDYFNNQKVEYYIVTHPTLYPELSGKWIDLRFSNEDNKEVIKDTYGTKKGELMYNPVSLVAKVGWWIVERGKMTHYLPDYNILNNRYFTTNKLNIQLLPSGNMTERMKQVKAEKERKAAEAVKEKERKAAEATQEDQDVEKNATPILCSETAINLNDKVKYDKREGIVTGFEITYNDNTDPKTQTVRCDDKLFSITAGIEKIKSDLFTKRNPGVVYASVVAGSRKRRRKRKTSKTR